MAAAMLCVTAASHASDVSGPERPVTMRPERFVAGEAFKAGGRIGDQVLIVVGFNFEKYFGPLVEAGVAGNPLEMWTLGHSADDAALIAMIGGEQDIEVSLSSIHRLMALGDRGDSHTGGHSNFAYVRSPVDGRLWAIHWTMTVAREWIIGAVPVPHPDLDWPSGSRLFVVAGADQRARRQACAAPSRLLCPARP